jgi:hypothetical protein
MNLKDDKQQNTQTQLDLNEAEAADASREHSSAMMTASGVW